MSPPEFMCHETRLYEKTKPGQQGWSIGTEKERARVPLTQLHNMQGWDACGGPGTRTTTPVFLCWGSPTNGPMICNARLSG